MSGDLTLGQALALLAGKATLHTMPAPGAPSVHIVPDLDALRPLLEQPVTLSPTRLVFRTPDGSSGGWAVRMAAAPEP